VGIRASLGRDVGKRASSLTCGRIDFVSKSGSGFRTLEPPADEHPFGSIGLRTARRVLKQLAYPETSFVQLGL
jgi:hypothetical protein